MRVHITRPIVAVTVAMSFGLAGPALAKSNRTKAQLSYEDAWAVCKKFVDEGVKSWDQHTQRYARGAACMKKYGYQI
jgi:hypothetical protein